MYDNPSGNETVRCSFCGKTQEEVKKIVSTGVKKNFFENCWDFVTHLFSRD